MEASMRVKPHPHRHRVDPPPASNPPPPRRSTADATPWCPAELEEAAAEARLAAADPPSARAHELSAAEELERQRRVSDAARIRGSYRYLRHGLEPTAALKRRESRYYRQLEPPTSRCSSSASRTLPPRRLNYGNGEASSSRGGRPVPRFDPGDYVADDDIPKLAEELERKAPALTAGDFVPASALGTVTALLEEKTCRDAEKAEEWRREQEAHDAKYIEISDSDESE